MTLKIYYILMMLTYSTRKKLIGYSSLLWDKRIVLKNTKKM